MAQHGYNIPNQTGLQFRGDLNDALAAIVTQNSDEATLTAPSSTFAYQYYIDTTNDILYQRDGANSAWNSIRKLDTGNTLHLYRESQGTIQRWAADLGTNTRSCDLLSPESDSQTEPFIFQTGNSWLFRVDTTDALTIDSVGHVSIGLTNPSDFKVNADDLVVGDLTSGDGHGITVACSSANAGRICFADGTDSTSEQSGMLVYVHTDDSMQFHVAGSQVGLFNGDDFFVGDFSGGSTIGGAVKAKGFNTRTGHTGAFGGHVFNINWTGSAAQLYINTSNVGTISLSSDYRIKKDVESISVNCIDRIKQLRPVQYEFGNYGELFAPDGVVREGFIAHEVANVISSGVEGEKDDPNCIQSLRLDAILSVTVKALQEAVAKIETLETSVAALEARVTALESP